MARLLNRNVAITIAKPQSFFIQAPNAVMVRNLRVVFNVEKNLGEDPNTCEVKVYNLAERTRGEVQVKPIHVRVDAGYDGQTERLFTGDVRHAFSRRLPTDWETVIQVADGDRAHRFARVNRSFKSGVSAKQAIAECAKAMGLKLPKTADDARGLVTAFTSGLTLQGPASAELTRLLTPHGFTHSIQDGRLQILQDGQATEAEAVVISQDTGMIGSPEFGTPEKSGEKPTLSVKSLLKPAVSAGGLVKVESLSINGVFKVIKVVHSGDTHGSDWFTTIEAKEIKL
jgi:hypothetical protein